MLVVVIRSVVTIGVAETEEVDVESGSVLVVDVVVRVDVFEVVGSFVDVVLVVSSILSKLMLRFGTVTRSSGSSSQYSGFSGPISGRSGCFPVG